MAAEVAAEAGRAVAPSKAAAPTAPRNSRRGTGGVGRLVPGRSWRSESSILYVSLSIFVLFVLEDCCDVKGRTAPATVRTIATTVT
ncbi:hypothetical protein GCM10010320_72020 [Streptomyces caelestis]|nr:hypothetical protein GCM10010320_72020 [Streptomyces caelestis]